MPNLFKGEKESFTAKDSEGNRPETEIRAVLSIFGLLAIYLSTQVTTSLWTLSSCTLIGCASRYTHELCIQ